LSAGEKLNAADDKASGLPPSPDSPDTTPFATHVICPRCGYDLHGLTSERCPECGLSVDTVIAMGSMPWIHRHAVGVLRAYIRTIWAVTFRGRGLFSNLAGRVDYADAQRFRWATVAVFATTVVVGVVIPTVFDSGYRGWLMLNAWWAGVMIGGVCLALAALTGLPSYCFDRRNFSAADRGRGLGMSYYACAPVAWVWVILPPLLGGILSSGPFRLVCGGLALSMGLGVMFVWWLGLVRLGKALLPNRRATGCMAVAVPTLWVLVGGLIGLGVPWLVLYVATVVSALG